MCWFDISKRCLFCGVNEKDRSAVQFWRTRKIFAAISQQARVKLVCLLEKDLSYPILLDATAANHGRQAGRPAGVRLRTNAKGKVRSK